MNNIIMTLSVIIIIIAIALSLVVFGFKLGIRSPIVTNKYIKCLESGAEKDFCEANSRLLNKTND